MHWVLELLLSLRNILIVVLTPLILLPVTLCIPGQSTSLMFLGGMAVGVAIEEWDIHKRIALKILLTIGSKPVWLMLGLMLTAWFLSMWISNTATVAMMLPIATAILEQLKDNRKRAAKHRDANTELLPTKNGTDDVHNRNNSNCVHAEDIEMTVGLRDAATTDHHYDDFEDDNDVLVDKKEEEAWTRFSKCLCLCIAYAANIGGTASMTGSTPNLVLKGQLDIVYKSLAADNPLTFGKWLAFGAPTSLVIILLSWLWMQIYFLRGVAGCCIRQGNEEEKTIRAILKHQYKNLGSFTFAQVAVLVHLILIALLWITRDMGGAYGWSAIFKDEFIKDSVPAVFVACLLFIFPSEIPRMKSAIQSSPIKPLLSWKVFNAKMPWGVILLLGGGFAMAKASQVSGLSSWIGSQLMELSHLDSWVLNLVICFIVAAATEVTSNTATTSLMLPILADLSLKIGLQPLYLMYPVSFAASFAFMLPVATPPNVVVFSYGYVKVIDMIKAGFMLNLIAVAVLVVCNEFLGAAIFGTKLL